MPLICTFTADENDCLGWKFTAMHGDLIDNMDGKDVVKMLHSKSIIGADELSRLKAMRDNSECNRQLLAVLHRKQHPTKYVELHRALRQNNNADVIALIDHAGWYFSRRHTNYYTITFYSKVLINALSARLCSLMAELVNNNQKCSCSATD